MTLPPTTNGWFASAHEFFRATPLLFLSIHQLWQNLDREQRPLCPFGRSAIPYPLPSLQEEVLNSLSEPGTQLHQSNRSLCLVGNDPRCNDRQVLRQQLTPHQ